MLHLMTGGAGSGKSTRLAEEIERAIEQNQNVFVMVPEQFSFEYEVRLYRRLGVKRFHQISVFSFTTLAQDLFCRYGGRSGEYASDLTKTILLYQTIRALTKSAALPYFGTQTQKQSFLDSALKLIGELRKAGLSPADFAAHAETLNDRLRDKTMDLATLYAAYDKALSDHGYKDSLTDISEAAAIANGNDHFRGAAVFLDEFESFTGDQLEMLEGMITEAQDVFVTLRTEDPAAPDFSVFDTTNATYRQLNRLAAQQHVETKRIPCEGTHRFHHADLAHLSRSILRTHRAVSDESSEHIRIIEAKNCYEEADFVCAAIRRLVEQKRASFRDIAVVTHQLSEYAGILEAACERYDIPYFLDCKHGVMHTAVMQLITAVIGLIAATVPSTEGMLRLAKTQLLGISCERIHALETYCYTWNVEGAMWLSPFPDSAPEDLECLRLLLTAPLTALREDCRHAPVQEVCRALFVYLQDMEIPSHISGVARTYRDNGFPEEAAALKRLWGDLMELLDTLCTVMADQTLTLPQFRDLLTAMLRGLHYSSPPQTLDSVLIMPAETARFNDPKFTFVLGMNEGYFPSEIHLGGLLSEDEKQTLAESGLCLSRSAQSLVWDERLIAYKTLSSASEGLFLLYPLASEAGTERLPSFLIDQIRALFPNEIRSYAEHYDADFYAATAKAAYYRLVQDSQTDSPEQASVAAALRESPVYAAKLSMLSSLSERPAFALSNPTMLRRVFGDTLPISATKLETYQLCPFSFYLERGLKVSVPQKKEINPLEIGLLVHFCLERILSGCPDKAAFDALSQAEIRTLTQQAAQEYLDTQLGGSFGKDSRFAHNFQRLTAGIPDLIAHLQAELRQSKFRPVAFELTISQDAPICLKAPNGVEIRLNGKIDRVDLYEADGKQYLRVIDYKTGGKKLSLANLLYGIDLQMFLYLFALLEPGSPYAGAHPAGVLYVPSGTPKCDRDREQAMDDGDLLRAKNKHYRMNGVLLREREVLNAMELGLEGVFLPDPRSKDDPGKGELVLSPKATGYLTDAQFARLREHARGLLTDMAEKLYAGQIAASPLKRKDKDPCTYCSYHEICGHEEDGECRTPAPDAEEQMLRILSGEEEIHHA